MFFFVADGVAQRSDDATKETGESTIAFVERPLKACLKIGFRIVSPGIHSGVQGVRIDKNRFNGFTYVLSKPLKRFGVEARPDPRNQLRG